MHWLEQHQFPCLFQSYFGLACPGCGFQRALLLLLNGDISASILRYPALIPFFVTPLILVLHLIFRFEHGARWLIVSFSITAALVAGNYITRLLLYGPHYL